VSLAARAYIVGTAATGLFLAWLGVEGWTGTQPWRFICFLALAVLSSAWKVSLPGVTSTLSVNYIFVLIAASECDFPQTLLIATLAAIAQCILRAKSRPQTVHLVFNASSAAITSACSYAAFHLVWGTKVQSIPLLFLATATAYYLSNSAAISGVICLTERKKFFDVFRESYLWTAPQYLVGATVAAIFSAISLKFGWDWALLIIPVMVVVYGSYRLYLRRFEDERRHVKEVSELHLRTIEALAVAIDAKDETTHDHLRRVEVYALEIARTLKLTDDEIQALQAASLLHDIGKLAVPEYILSKPGRLTPEEFERIKIHPTVGAEILERVRFPYPVVPIVAAHHEKWDGSGYPNGLKGEEIPIGARILSTVDCFDALASDRQYRRALPLDEAIAKIVSQSGSSFDPKVVAVLAGRYRELERIAHDTHVETTKLSREVKTAHPVAPDAGFVKVVAQSSSESAGFVASIAQARQEFHAIYELMGVPGIFLTLENALAIIAAHLKTIVPYDCIAIYTIEKGMLLPKYVSGADSALFCSIRIPIGEGVSGYVAETQRAVVNGNPSVEPGCLRNPNICSVLLSVTSIPLFGSSGIIGVLSLYSRGKDAFTGDHVRLLEGVSSKTAFAIERAITAAREGDESLIDKPSHAGDAQALFRYLEARLERCARTGESLAVLVLMLDDLNVASRPARASSNALAARVSGALQNACHKDDFVAHLTTGEFVVVQSGSGGEFVLAATEAATLTQGGTPAIVTGLAVWPGDGNTPEALLAAADRKVYRQLVKRASAAAVSLCPSDTWNESVVS